MESKLDFTVDKVLYDGLPEFVAKLHDKGMKYIPILVRIDAILPNQNFRYNLSIVLNI